jgi:putative component of membrane protein insertase Oxa1/YidC/SpoIIIJ protein YidD
MKHFIIFLILISVSFFGVSQEVSDFDLLVDHVNTERSDDNENTKFKGLLKVYNKAITDQIINDCIYEESCSNFGQKSIENYGLVKGLFVTTDRLMRCNRLSQLHVLPVRVNKEGKISDPSDWYKK